MSYRNITVDGVDHRYTVGRTHVKIRGMQAVPIKRIAAEVHGGRLSVTPLRIATYIKLGYVPGDTPGPNILEEESTARMKRIAQEGKRMRDYEQCHGEADGLLCNVLVQLGYADLVKAYHQVPKWYA